MKGLLLSLAVSVNCQLNDLPQELIEGIVLAIPVQFDPSAFQDCRFSHNRARCLSLINAAWWAINPDDEVLESDAERIVEGLISAGQAFAILNPLRQLEIQIREVDRKWSSVSKRWLRLDKLVSVRGTSLEKFFSLARRYQTLARSSGFWLSFFPPRTPPKSIILAISDFLELVGVNEYFQRVCLEEQFSGISEFCKSDDGWETLRKMAGKPNARGENFREIRQIFWEALNAKEESDDLENSLEISSLEKIIRKIPVEFNPQLKQQCISTNDLEISCINDLVLPFAKILGHDVSPVDRGIVAAAIAAGRRALNELDGRIRLVRRLTRNTLGSVISKEGHLPGLLSRRVQHTIDIFNEPLSIPSLISLLPPLSAFEPSAYLFREWKAAGGDATMKFFRWLQNDTETERRREFWRRHWRVTTEGGLRRNFQVAIFERLYWKKFVDFVKLECQQMRHVISSIVNGQIAKGRIKEICKAVEPNIPTRTALLQLFLESEYDAIFFAAGFSILRFKLAITRTMRRPFRGSMLSGRTTQKVSSNPLSESLPRIERDKRQRLTHPVVHLEQPRKIA